MVPSRRIGRSDFTDDRAANRYGPFPRVAPTRPEVESCSSATPLVSEFLQDCASGGERILAGLRARAREQRGCRRYSDGDGDGREKFVAPPCDQVADDLLERGSGRGIP